VGDVLASVLMRHGSSLQLALALLLAACGPRTLGGGDNGGNAIPFTPPTETGSSSNLVLGGQAAVIASALNLRASIGADQTIVTAMPCGSLVQVIAGPSTTPVTGWWQVDYNDPEGNTYEGWAAGNYLIAASGFDPSLCGFVLDGGGIFDMGGMPVLTSSLQMDIINLAEEGVGYSYWWGHGTWSNDGSDPGSCSGDCPSCTHDGSYGADCSGYVAKVWQVPSASALADDEHPFATSDFYNDQTYWTQIDRSTIQQADALVYSNGSEGHIVLFDSGEDPFGSIWVYEAYGCATGIIHDMRTFDSTYRAIRLSSSCP
jgi:Bacterial SH3 domain